MKKGTKLIFVEDGGVLNTKTGTVVTFSNWWDKETAAKHSDYYKACPSALKGFDGYLKRRYFQCKEFPYKGHNLPISRVEIFDPKKHKGYNLLTKESALSSCNEFMNEH